LFDHIAVDPTTGAIWFAAEGNGRVSRLDPSTGAVREYNLPVYEEAILSCPAPEAEYEADCSAELRTRVRGLAITPDGDAYFSDGTMNRIGIIRVEE
jgi:streptogramin lyase